MAAPRVGLEVKGEVVKLLITAVALRDNESDASGIVAVFENISELEKMHGMSKANIGVFAQRTSIAKSWPEIEKNLTP